MGVYGHEKASKRLASLLAMGSATTRRYAAPPPDSTRYKQLEIERGGNARQYRLSSSARSVATAVSALETLNPTAQCIAEPLCAALLEPLRMKYLLSFRDQRSSLTRSCPLETRLLDQKYSGTYFATTLCVWRKSQHTIKSAERAPEGWCAPV